MCVCVRLRTTGPNIHVKAELSQFTCLSGFKQSCGHSAGTEIPDEVLQHSTNLPVYVCADFGYYKCEHNSGVNVGIVTI